MTSRADDANAMAKQSRQLGALCGVDMNGKDDNKIKTSPGFYWLMTENALPGEMSQSDIDAVKPAIKCNSSFGIEVDEKAARRILDERRKSGLSQRVS